MDPVPEIGNEEVQVLFANAGYNNALSKYGDSELTKKVNSDEYTYLSMEMTPYIGWK